MSIGILKSPNPRKRNSISTINSKFLSVSLMNTLLTILKVTDATRDVILAGGLSHRFPWRHRPPGTPTIFFRPMRIKNAAKFLVSVTLLKHTHRKLFRARKNMAGKSHLQYEVDVKPDETPFIVFLVSLV